MKGSNRVNSENDIQLTPAWHCRDEPPSAMILATGKVAAVQLSAGTFRRFFVLRQANGGHQVFSDCPSAGSTETLTIGDTASMVADIVLAIRESMPDEIVVTFVTRYQLVDDEVSAEDEFDEKIKTYLRTGDGELLPRGRALALVWERRFPWAGRMFLGPLLGVDLPTPADLQSEKANVPVMVEVDYTEQLAGPLHGLLAKSLKTGSLHFGSE